MNNLFTPQLTKQVIIGTNSKSRRNLFRKLNLKFNYRSANIDEKQVSNLKNNQNDALKIAIAKAKHLSSKYKNKMIVTFDTTILFNRKTVYKCNNPECCIRLLNSFNNKQHVLFTGMVFMVNNKIIQKKLTKTKIFFNNNNKKKIGHYVKKNFIQIKSAVGCYNLEGMGIDLFQNIDKSYFNVLGLDIINFLKLLRKI
jgi:septum formation protein